MDLLTVLISFLISCTVVGTLFLPGIKIGLNTADEGYLHFGSVNLLEGKTPIRDFRAYDPGRYYWCALWMRFFAPTFTAQRLAMGAVIAVSLSMVCSWVFYLGQNWTLATLGTLLTFTWIRPYFKAFEILFCLIAIAVSFSIITNPGTSSYLLSGFIIGISLFFGLNFGLYLGLSALTALLTVFVLHLSDLFFAPMVWMMSGFVLGLTPMLLLGFRNPGYFSTYWEKKVLTVIKRGTSNLPLPLPWYWSASPQLNGFSPARRAFFKAVFTGLIPFYSLTLVAGFTLFDVYPNRGGLIISASLVGFVYLHHLFSRADVSHMCQTIHPAILLTALLLSTFLPWQWATLSLGVICILSAWAILPKLSNLFNFTFNKQDYKNYDTGKEILKIKDGQAKTLTLLRQVVDACTVKGDKVLFASSIPGFYRLFDRQPALYDVYCIYPETEDKQREMIKSLVKHEVKFFIIFDQPVDQKDELRFSKTHPLVWQYLYKNFVLVKNSHLPKIAKVFTTGDNGVVVNEVTS